MAQEDGKWQRIVLGLVEDTVQQEIEQVNNAWKLPRPRLTILAGPCVILIILIGTYDARMLRSFFRICFFLPGGCASEPLKNVKVEPKKLPRKLSHN